MSKKDYEKAARIAQGFASLQREAVEQAFVALFLEDGNPHFDVKRFRAACVPGANVKVRKAASA